MCYVSGQLCCKRAVANELRPVVVLILNLPLNLTRCFGHSTWIAKWRAALQKEERRLARNQARTKLGKFEGKRDAAHDRERGQMGELIWTVPTTATGLAELLGYCRENETINGLVGSDTWEDVLEWTMECAACALAGLPMPPMSEVMAEEAEHRPAAA
jgi:hypothetical protein